MRPEAPFLFLIFVQFLGILGDTLSQRCLRVVHRNSYRRFLTSLSVSSFLLCFFILSTFQLFAPDSLRRIDKLFPSTSSATNNTNNSLSTTWNLIDICDGNQNFTKLLENASTWIDRLALEEKRKSCFAQGPLTIWRIVYACPMLLVICLFNVPLYFAYPILLRDASGIVLYIVAATMAGLLVQPFTRQFEGEDDGEATGTTSLGGVRAISIILGLVGAVLCTIEKRIGLKEKLKRRREAQRRLERAQQAQDVEERERNRLYGPGSFRSRHDQIEEEARAQEREDERNARENELAEQERGELVEMMADEDVDRLPINDEGFRRSASDAPTSFWDFVDRAALEADDENRPSFRRGEYDDDDLSFWFCCLCMDTCSCLRCRCCCCFRPCWGSFWKAVANGVMKFLARVRKFLLSLPPFLAVVACVSIFLGLSRYVEDHCDVNPYGLVTVDQMFLPVLILPMIFAWDFLSGTKHLVLLCCCYCGFNNAKEDDANVVAVNNNRRAVIDNNNDDDGEEQQNGVNNSSSAVVVSSHQQRFPSATRGHRRVELDGIDDTEETFGVMWSHAWRELKADYCAGLFQVMICRVLIGARQLGYAFLVIWYDIRSFAEMTLVQIVLSWFAMMFCVLVIPSFINATPDEQRTVSYRWNVGAKFFGSLVLAASVFLMHSSFI